MAKSASVAKGIFCLEGEWSSNLTDQSSVEHALILLSKMPPYHTPYIRRDVATRAEFDHYVTRWGRAKYGNYPILYLAFHGAEGAIQFGDFRKKENLVTLEELGRSLEGQCRGRIIYFSSCDTMGEHGNRLRSFLRRTDALAVCGFRLYVDWLTSMAFDLLFLRQAQYNAFTLGGARAIGRRVRDEAAGLASQLGFRMMFNDG